MPSMKTAIAAGATVVALGGLTAVALSAGATDKVTTSVPAATSPPRTEVRIEIVKQVIHRTRRAKATRTSAGGGAATPTAAPPAAARVASATVRVAAPARAIRASVDDPRDRREAGDDGPGHDAGGGDD